MTDRQPLARSRAALAAVYGAAVLVGVAMVSFPASSAILKRLHGFSDAQYGSIFLPQVAMVVLGSLLGGTLADRLGLRRLLAMAFVALSFSQAALWTSAALAPAAAYVSVLVGTSCLGLGYGLAAAPLNTYPTLLFPARHDAAIVAMHTAMGLGLSLGPLFGGASEAAGLWVAFPAGLMALSAFLVAVTLATPLPAPASASGGASGQPAEPRPLGQLAFWLFAAIAMLYALAEGTFSNWVLLYLAEERGIAPAMASLALAAFWGAMTAGRLLVSALLLRVRARRIWLAMPVLMAAACLALPLARTARSGVVLFAGAGLACSALFPLTVSLAARRFAKQGPWISSMLTAALMVGIAAGSLLIGSLRTRLPLERLYAYSAVWPLLALGLCAVLASRDEVP